MTKQNPMKLSICRFAWGLFALLSGSIHLLSQESKVALGPSAQGEDGWRLNLGKEFAGATGTIDRHGPDPSRQGASLVFTADFSSGGKYVAVEKRLAMPLNAKQLTFWLKADNLKQFGLRLVDSTGQMHQQRFAIESRRGWSEFAVKEFASPQHWFGANDGVWHGPATSVSFLVERDSVVDSSRQGGLFLSGIIAEGAEAVAAPETKPEPDISFELPRKLMYFWGRSDAPGEAALVVTGSSGTFELPPVRLLNYRGETIRELWKGIAVVQAGKPFRAEVDITPPSFGVFYLAADTATRRIRVPFAWLAEAAEPWPESPFGVQMHFAEGPTGKHQTLGGAGGALDLVKRMGASWIRDEYLLGREIRRGAFDPNGHFESLLLCRAGIEAASECAGGY